MLLWIILTIMTAAAAVWVSAPLLRRLDDRQSAAARDLEVYRDQLAEIDREQTEGSIDADQAAAAGLEIKRRMLATDQTRTGTTRQMSLGERHFAVVGVAGIVALGAVILYSNSGRPDLPSVAHAPTTLVLGDAGQGASFRPIQAGAAPAGRMPDSQYAASQSMPAQTAPQGGAAQGLGSVDDMIQRLVDRLAKEPGNFETWRMLGWSYFSTERFAQAASAYKKATELQPGNAELQTSYGEALVRAADGEVEPDALAAFDAALALDAKEPRARFFTGLRHEQSGNKQAALDTWIAVLGDAGPDDAWASDLKSRIVELARDIGVDIEGKLPVSAIATPDQAATGGILQALKSSGGPATAAAAPPARVPGGGPSADDINAADALTPGQRSEMIRGMVEGLAGRLETSPRDVDGWIQLIRSRKVMGDADAARIALGKALAVFGDSPHEQGLISTAATEIGVSR